MRDQIVANWELASSRIVRLNTKFQCWIYDPVFGPPDTYKTYEKGWMNFVDPLNWSYGVDTVRRYVPPKSPGSPATYDAAPDDQKWHWVCDGKSVFEFDRAKTQLIERQYPRPMLDRILSWTMLPFFVRVKADALDKRFHIRVITPIDETDDDWLELTSKTRIDAGVFQNVEVYLSRQSGLPTAVQVFDPEYKVWTNPARCVFLFSEQKLNGPSKVTEGVIACEFPFKLPQGWKHIVEMYPADGNAVPSDSTERK